MAPYGDAAYDYSVKLGDGALDLGKDFILTNSGTSRLTRHSRICFPSTNGILQVIVLPPVTAPVHVIEE